ncbi:hypothetical protein FPV67DRAFT_1494039 [Lyophyllum atratum]|nr:hypothetical protein FPV67DRAFT_1494039 [Lyophyllum atratum]
MTLDISFSSPFTNPRCRCTSGLSGFPTLTSVGTSSIARLHATADELLHHNDHSTVYAAILTHDNSRVVLKLSLGWESLEDLKREANHYELQLKDVQGDIVPRYYGMYEGTCTSHSSRKIGCLVLEYCGKHVIGLFRDLPLDERVEILNVLSALHAHGAHHSRFAERNVVKDSNGKYRLIDFTRLRKHDGCHFDNNWRAGEHVDDVEMMKCGILENQACYMNIWEDPDANPQHVIIGGEEYPGKLFPPQEIIDTLLVDKDYINRAFNLDARRAWLLDVKHHIDANPEKPDREIVEYGKSTEHSAGLVKSWDERIAQHRSAPM